MPGTAAMREEEILHLPALEVTTIATSTPEEGMAVVFISSEIEEILRTCERMVGMRDGSKVGERPHQDCRQKAQDQRACIDRGRPLAAG